MTVLSDVAILDRINSHFTGYSDDQLMWAEAQMLQGKPNPYRIEIDPFIESDLQGASVDLRLGETIIYRGQNHVLPQHTIQNAFLLPPGGTCLAQTSARIHTPHDCVARVEGKSSIGRQFVVVHCTAGWCDPGFDGYITLEIANHSDMHSFLLEPNMPICQLTFLQLDQPAERQYKGKYQNAKGVEAHKP